MRAAICLIVLGLSAGPSALGAAILMAGETLRVDFQLAPPACSGGPCDTLLVFPSADQAFSPVVDAVTLFDGATVLGSMTATYAPAFTSAGSALLPGTAAIVDFTDILNGTIDGSITFTLSSGSITWTSGVPGLNLTLGRAIAPGLIMAGSSVVITGVSITGGTPIGPEVLAAEVIHNPEPGTLWLAAGGGLLLWGLRRYRRG